MSLITLKYEFKIKLVHREMKKTTLYKERVREGRDVLCASVYHPSKSTRFP
jgi:hypothetical protein